jgi:hypothetical protein
MFFYTMWKVPFVEATYLNVTQFVLFMIRYAVGKVKNEKNSSYDFCSDPACRRSSSRIIC